MPKAENWLKSTCEIWGEIQANILDSRGGRMRKCVPLIAASTLAARKLPNCDAGKRVPETMSAIADTIKWAEEIMKEIDRRWPATKAS